MPAPKTADRVVVSVQATESGDWQVVSTPTGFQGITTAAGFADNDYLHGFVRFENGTDWEVYDTDDGTSTTLLQISNITGTVTISRPATPYASSNSGDRVNAGSGTHTLTISLGSGTMKRIIREINGEWKTLTSGDATPDVSGYRLFKTAGTTAITAFDGMEDGKLFIIRRGASDISINDGAGISLPGDNNITLTTGNPAAIFVEDNGVAYLIGTVGADVLDEDDFASDSATKPPSQQSVAAYIASRGTIPQSVPAAGVGGTGDAITLTVTGGPALADGLTLSFVPGAANTGAVTVNYNAGGALALVDEDDAALVADALSTTAPIFIRYTSSGTKWRRVAGGGSAKTVATLAALKLLNGASHLDGERVEIRGLLAEGDLGGGSFIYDAGSSATADDGVIVAPADGTGRFIRAEWFFRNEVHLRWYGFFTGESASDLETALNAAFDFVDAATVDGVLIFPQGAYNVQWTTNREFIKLRGWKFKGAGASQDTKIGTQINLTGGGATYFFKITGARFFVLEDIVIRLAGAGFTHNLEIAGGIYYEADGTTPVASPVDSSYLNTLRNVMLTADVAGGFDPTVCQLFIHSSVINYLDNVWILNANVAMKLGDTAANDIRTLAKGTCGGLILNNCYLIGNIEYIRLTQFEMNGGQWFGASGTGGADRAQMIAGTSADICDLITFRGVGIPQFTGDPTFAGDFIKGLTIEDCNFGGSASSNFIEVGGESTGIRVINCTHQMNGGSIIKINADCAAASEFLVSGISQHPTTSTDYDFAIEDLRTLAPTDSIRPIGENYAMNPDFSIAQRGTSFVPAASTNMFDGWRGRRSGNVAGSTYSQQAGFSNAQYCARIQRDSGNSGTENIYFWHQIESATARAFAGKAIRVSADIRAGDDYSDAASDVTCTIYSGTGVDEVVNAASGFATGNATSASQRVITTTAQRIQWTAAVLGSSVTEIAVVFNYLPAGTAGAADYFEITNIKIEIVDPKNNSATLYRPADPVAEYQKCLRRYEKSFALATAPAQNVGLNTGEYSAIATVAGANTNRVPRVRYRVPKRDVGVLATYNPAAANEQLRDATAGADTSARAGVNQTAEGFELSCTGNASTAVGNRLVFHWSVDAEID